MKKIASFCVDHDKLKKGVYVSRIDCGVITYDLRMKTPNGGDYLGNAEMHTLEHLLATYTRNSKYKDSVIYAGPMGCRTGFYFLVRDDVSGSEILMLIKQAFGFAAGFTGEIPGSKRKECGNYLEHDLDGAKKTAAQFLEVLNSFAVIEPPPFL